MKTNALRDLIRKKNTKSTQITSTPVCQACIKEQQHQNLLLIAKTLEKFQHVYGIEDDIYVCQECGLTFGPVVVPGYR